jgi:glutaminyl-peptide cyclotransferase
MLTFQLEGVEDVMAHLLKKRIVVPCSIVFVFLCNGCNSQTFPQFDETRAYANLVQQCEFGPRDPGSEGHRKCLNYLYNELNKWADRVSTQKFTHTFGNPTKSVIATNIIAHFQPQKKDRILLCAHWDTRPWADEDPNKANRMMPILGANDGASGVAVLLEIARLISLYEPNVGVDIVLFDAEDSGIAGNNRSWACGSQTFAREKDFQYQPRFGILLDLIGDADLQIYVEQYSLQYAPQVVDLVWKKAAELGISEFIRTPKFAVYDDHVPLLEVGIPCIDVIDFDYPYWHTIEDTPDKCSAESLGKVGRTIVAVLYK